MSSKHAFYPESRFGGFTNVDGTIAFYLRLNEFVRPDHLVLDVGCGRGALTDDPIRVHRALRDFRGRCRKVVGIDVDQAARENPFVNEFRLIEGPRWPVDGGSVDIAFADFVLEHVPDPDAFFGELARVLGPEGIVGIRTSNALGYVTLLSKCLPASLRPRVLKRAQPDRREEDVFRTVHRCNTVWKLRQALESRGFEACVFGYEAEPSYLDASRLLYGIGVIHQRLAPGFLKLALFAYGRKRR